MTHAAINEMKVSLRKHEYDRDLRSRGKLTAKEIGAIKKSATSHLITYAGPDVKFRISALKIEILCDMAIDRMPKQINMFVGGSNNESS